MTHNWCNRMVAGMMSAAWLGGTLFGGCSALIHVPGLEVDVSDDSVFVDVFGISVDVDGDRIAIEVPNFVFDIVGHSHHHW